MMTLGPAEGMPFISYEFRYERFGAPFFTCGEAGFDSELAELWELAAGTTDGVIAVEYAGGDER